MNGKNTDLATSIGAAILGVIIAYFVCNIFIGSGEPVKVKTLDTSISASFADPSVEVFNYKALNPTVEVYVGECQEYDQDGNCIDAAATKQDQENLEEIIENSPTEAVESPEAQEQETE